jgi:hypothetical protein
MFNYDAFIVKNEENIKYFFHNLILKIIFRVAEMRKHDFDEGVVWSFIVGPIK